MDSDIGKRLEELYGSEHPQWQHDDWEEQIEEEFRRDAYPKQPTGTAEPGLAPGSAEEQAIEQTTFQHVSSPSAEVASPAEDSAGPSVAVVLGIVICISVLLLVLLYIQHQGTEHSGSPPHVFANPSFNCSLARTTVERLICRDADLADLDRRMAGAYYTALSGNHGVESRRLRQHHLRWFRNYQHTCNGLTGQPDSLIHSCVAKYLVDETNVLKAWHK